MSKIFDGLKRSKGEIADLAISVVGDPGLPVNAGKDFFRERSSEEPDGPDDGEVAVAALRSRTPGLRGESSKGRTIPHGGADSSWSSPHESPFSPVQKSAVIRLRAGSPLLPFDTGKADLAADEYRRIRTRIIQHPRAPRLILISSPAPGDGKSVTAVNIAAALALSRESRVLLVDMDLRRPKAAELLGVEEVDGVSEILAGSRSFDNTVIRLEPFPNLFLLPAGRDRSNPTELITSPQWKTLCEDCRSRMTYTIFDGPPVDGVAEYSLLQERTDGLILVVRTDHTDRSLLFGALESIPKDKLLGSVVNSYKESLFWKKRGGYYYS